METFKRQPWLQLLQVAAIAILLVTIIDVVIIVALSYSQLLYRIVGPLLSSPLGLILSLAAMAGVGALGVYLCESWQRQVILSNNSLWALVLCLIGMLALKSLLPLPELFVSLSYYNVIGMLVGVFWKGRPYWR